MITRYLLSFIICCIWWHVASAIGLKSDTYYNVWGPSEAVFSKKIDSTSHQAQFFVVKIMRSGGPDSRVVETLLSTKQMIDQVFVMPNHLALMPGRSKIIRLTFPKGRHNNIEQYYRINVIPVTPTRQLGFSDAEIKLSQDLPHQAAIGQTNMRFGLSTALVVLPLHPHYQFNIRRSKSSLNIDNQGNAVLSVTLHGHCGIQRNKACRLAARIYPGKQQTIDISTFTGPIRLYFAGYHYHAERIV